ncbi:MAG: DUF6526 family protein [Bryobacteraceae bacterium]
MESQNFSNHAQLVTGYHKILLPVLLLTFIGSCVNLYMSLGDHQRLYSASLLVVLSACLMALSIYARVFALKAQDRAIRAEENLRHYLQTGKLLDARLSPQQIVALRFASDGEFAALAARAAESAMAPVEIKKAVTAWRADLYRA